MVIVNDTQSHAKQAGYSRFTRSIFDTWGIGRAEVNDGVLLAVFVYKVDASRCGRGPVQRRLQLMDRPDDVA